MSALSAASVNELRSLIGPQADSRKETAPSYGFGTSDRNSVQVIYGGGKAKGAGAPQARTTKLSPGPIYLPSNSSKAPKFSFGGQGNGIGIQMARRAGAAPGPGEYDLTGAIGKQPNSNVKTSPAYGWAGSGSARDAAAAALAAGQSAKCDTFYELSASIGPQQQSTKRTQSSYAFGTAQRFMGEQTGLRRSAASPGPGAYKLREASKATVEHHEATSRTQPAYGFGTQPRFNPPAGTTRSGRAQPGPGGYQHGNGLGKQATTDRRTAPSYGFGSSRRFGGSVLTAANGVTPGPGAYNA